MSRRYPVFLTDQPARYQVCFIGRVQVDWTDWMDDLESEVQPGEVGQSPRTLLTGVVNDQSALFGLLSRIRDLGLPLLLVECLGLKL